MLIAAHHSNSFWTVVGVLATAVFTGGILLLGSIDSLLTHKRRHTAIAHALALTVIRGGWIQRDEDEAVNAYFGHFALELHNSADEPLLYEVEELRLRIGDCSPGDPDYLSRGSVIAARLTERFTIPAFQVPVAEVPGEGRLVLAMKYGRATRGYEWREKREVVFPVPRPGADSVPLGQEMTLMWTRVGVPVIEEIKKRRR